MSSSSSEAPGRLRGRLALALAASLAAHAALVAALEGRVGPAPGAPATARAGVLRAELRAEAPRPAAPAAAPAAAAQPAPAKKELPAAPRYYNRGELDVPPNIRTPVEPEYPQLARASGKVAIRLFIDEQGTVEHVAILRAEPAGLFEASARRAFLAARFTPGMKNGKPVRSQLAFELDYIDPRQ